MSVEHMLHRPVTDTLPKNWLVIHLFLPTFSKYLLQACKSLFSRTLRKVNVCITHTPNLLYTKHIQTIAQTYGLSLLHVCLTTNFAARGVNN